MSRSTGYRSTPPGHISSPPTDGSLRTGTALRSWAVAALFVVAGTVGCATSGPSFTDTSLTSAEIRELQDRYSSAYDFLQTHGRVSFAEAGRTGDE